MSASLITLIAGVFLGLIGICLRKVSERKPETAGICTDKPSFVHRNLRLMGGFRRGDAKHYYYSYCFGPLPLFPLGCYSAKDSKISSITGKQHPEFMEIASLYLRWGWLIAAVALLTIIF